MANKKKKAFKPNNHKKPKCSYKIPMILTVLSSIVRIVKDIYDMFK